MTAWLQVWLILLHGLFSQAVLPWPGTSVPVTPPPLSGMLWWYEANVGNNCSGGACTDGATQDTFADQSGNGTTGHGDGTLALGTAGPNCSSGVYHTNQINGKPAVTFNGSGTTPTCFAHAQTGIIQTHKASVFVVAKLAAACASATCSFMGGNGGSLNWQIPNSSLKSAANKACQALIGNSTTTLSTATWYQLNLTYDDSTGAWAFRVAKAAAGSGSNTQTLTGENLGFGGNDCSVGSLEPFAGQIAEFILYNRVLSGAEITTVETYFNSKYGL